MGSRRRGPRPAGRPRGMETSCRIDDMPRASLPTGSGNRPDRLPRKVRCADRNLRRHRNLGPHSGPYEDHLNKALRSRWETGTLLVPTREHFPDPCIPRPSQDDGIPLESVWTDARPSASLPPNPARIGGPPPGLHEAAADKDAPAMPPTATTPRHPPDRHRRLKSNAFSLSVYGDPRARSTT